MFKKICFALCTYWIMASDSSSKIQSLGLSPDIAIICMFRVSYYDKKTFAFPLYLRPFGNSNQRSLVTFKRFPFFVFLVSMLSLKQVLSSLFKPFSCDSVLCQEKAITGGQYLLLIFFASWLLSWPHLHFGLMPKFLSSCPTWSAHCRNSIFSSLLCLL